MYCPFINAFDDSITQPHTDRQLLTYSGARGCVKKRRRKRNVCPSTIIIVIITSVFNTDASLPYNHDLSESLIVKEGIKADGGGVLAYHNHSEVPTPPDIYAGNLDRNSKNSTGSHIL
ncbi:hypothetical protein T265_07674 [Opisthorchis viverrini]|uniref:Uncharacterized protein n=1 Tax=Opisthorchis viverrini TaxID=6198 RepID=A0A074ZBQ6_OPIVI|nr:hypothetical protein T265_07674 [Opisthorchis viverrini]KER24716.1 hypothetical protein T265_07674 [Opisthorchis viverrini]